MNNIFTPEKLHALVERFSPALSAAINPTTSAVTDDENLNNNNVRQTLSRDASSPQTNNVGGVDNPHQMYHVIHLMKILVLPH